MRLEDGSRLALVAGIVHIVFDTFFIGILLLVVLLFHGGMPFLGTGRVDPVRITVVFLGAFVMLGIGIMFLFCSRWMKNPSTVRRGAIISLVLGIISLPFLFIIGWTIAGIFGIVAGVIGLKKSKRQQKS